MLCSARTAAQRDYFFFLHTAELRLFGDLHDMHCLYNLYKNETICSPGTSLSCLLASNNPTNIWGNLWRSAYIIPHLSEHKRSRMMCIDNSLWQCKHTLNAGACASERKTGGLMYCAAEWGLVIRAVRTGMSFCGIVHTHIQPSFPAWLALQAAISWGEDRVFCSTH